MDRQYIIDNDVVENYLLGRLSAQEKEDYEAWLEKNPQGKSELEEERLLLNGIRQIGRADMKAEIRRQTEAARAAEVMRSQQSDFNWGMMLRVAAILLIVIAAPSLYYFTQINTPELQNTGAFDTETEGLMPALAEDEAAESDTAEPERMETEDVVAEKPVARRSRSAKKKEAIAAAPPAPPAEEAVVALGESRQDNVADLSSSIASGSGAAREAVSDKRQAGEDVGARVEGGITTLRDQPQPQLRVKANQDLEISEQLTQPSAKSSLAQNKRYKNFVRGEAATVFSYSPKSDDLFEEQADEYLSRDAARHQSDDDQINVPTFHFSSGNESIIVQYLLSENKVRSSYADRSSGFKVSLAGKSEEKLSMAWHVDKAFLDIPLERIKLIKLSNDLMEVVVDDSLYYEIDLKSDTTRAVRQKK